MPDKTILLKAKKENKLIIISIGYSACHWCHVMEEESFEDLEVAKIMNENGTEWCKNNKDEILSWMQEEANKRNLPFLKFGAKRILNYAISKAEKKGI